MKKLTIFLTVILTSHCFGANIPKTAEAFDVENPIQRLDHIIAATEQSLDNERKLREYLVEYQNLMTRYEQDTENKELLFKLIRSAYRTEKMIEMTYLSHAFTPDFLSELAMLSKVAKKQGIPRP